MHKNRFIKYTTTFLHAFFVGKIKKTGKIFKIMMYTNAKRKQTAVSLVANHIYRQTILKLLNKDCKKITGLIHPTTT